jgi:arabinogalactan oligomer / maltooligosaccharide transport system permease protein
MSAQAQMEEIRRLSGEHKPAPAAPEPERPLSKRVAIAMLLAALLGVGLLHWVLIQRFAAQTDARAERAAMISARAAADVANSFGGEGDGLRAAMAAWQKEHPNVAALRVVNIDTRSFEASSFAEDLKEGEVPRQMQRPEKPLYDLGQEIRADVETNVSEGRKREDEIAISRAGGAILIAAPVEKDDSVIGFVQVKGRPEIVAVEVPSFWFALAFAIAPFVVVFALSFVMRRELALVVIACALLLVTLFAYRQWAMRTLEGGARAAEQRFTERVLRESGIVTRIAPGTEAKAPTWDADIRRVPLKIDPVRAVEGEKSAVANASYGIGLLSLLLLLFVGTTAASRTAASLSEHRQAYFFVLPAMLGMLLLVFFPFVYGIAMSFTSRTIYSVNKPYAEVFVGVQNYIEILGDFALRGAAGINYENFYWTFFFTIVWTITNVAIGVTVGLLLALILNTKDLRFKTLYRVLLVLPWAMPNYITSLIWKGMFHQQFGVINQVIQLFGGQPIAWFERPFTSFCAVIATNGWLSFPFMMVVSLGALQSIPADLYEAARVDGATRWQQFRSITLPSLKPALVPAIILSVVWTFNMFNIIYLVSAGEPAHSTEILTTQAYKLAFEQYRYGYAAAYSVVIFAILLIYGVFQNRVSRGTEAIA